jgi:hypothetical protein
MEVLLTLAISKKGEGGDEESVRGGKWMEIRK